MSLIEIMVALGILAFLSMSVIGVTFQIRSMAEQTVYQNTAMTLAQGYMEQVRHLDYSTLKKVSQDNTIPLPLDRTDGTPVIPIAGAFFGNGTWASEIVYLDQNASGAKIQPMTFQFRVSLVSLESAYTTALAAAVAAGTTLPNPASGVEVSIQYQITYNYGVTRTTTGVLRSVRSSVPSY